MTPHLHLVPTPPDGEQTPGKRDPIRVAIADDHQLLRRSLSLLLDHEADFEVVAEAHDLASAMQAVEQRHPRVLVLDLTMPDGSATELLGALRDRSPRIDVVVLTMEQNPAFAQYALEAGATGFAAKELADSELAQAVRAAARGERYVSAQIADRLELWTQRPHSADGQAGAP